MKSLYSSLELGSSSYFLTRIIWKIMCSIRGKVFCVGSLLGSRLLTRILILAIVGVSWAFPTSIRQTLLSWHGSFVGKRCKKALMAAPFSLFWTIWLERSRIVFDNKAILVHRMKTSFLCNLWSWTNLCIVDRPASLLVFFNLARL